MATVCDATNLNRFSPTKLAATAGNQKESTRRMRRCLMTYGLCGRHFAIRERHERGRDAFTIARKNRLERLPVLI